MVGANRTACADLGHKHLNRRRARACRTLRAAHRIVTPTDWPPRDPRSGNRSYALALVRRCYALAGTDLPLRSARESVSRATSTEEIPNTDAGRLPSSTERPTHISVSLGLPAKQAAVPPVEVRSSGNGWTHCTRTDIPRHYSSGSSSQENSRYSVGLKGRTQMTPGC